MLSIQVAGIPDIPMIRQLAFAIWPHTYSHIISKEQIAYMLDMMYSSDSLQKQMNEDDCTFIIVLDNQEPIAFASYAPHAAGDATSKTIWKLHKIYILPSKQGKGTGRYIIHYIANDITKKGATALQLQVNRNNKAKDFYNKIGFRIIKTADFDIGNGFFMQDHVMELAI